MTGLVLRPCGDAAVLAEVADLGAALALHARLLADPPDGIEDLVPAARTVLVRFDPRRATTADVGAWVRGRSAAPGGEAAGRPARVATPPSRVAAAGAAPDRVVEIPVVYDGEDLDEVADRTALTRDEVVAAHAGTLWRVAFAGFAPGFGYLVPEDGPAADGRLRVPRRSESRVRIPAGSVGLADAFSGVYPRTSPGGWQLIGRTDAVLFDPAADPPAPLAAGVAVRFVAAERLASERRGADRGAGRHGDREAGRGRAAPGDDDARPDGGHRAGTEAAADPRAGDRRPGPAHRAAPPDDGVRAALLVERPGPRTVVQDRGRPGRADIGVGRSGAADRGALRLANRLVGNAPGAAALETVGGGLRLRARGPLVVAVTGAEAPATVDGRAVGSNAPLHLDDGAVLDVGSPAAGLRTVLAVRGGVDVPAVLGSRSHDALADLGPPPLRAADVLPVGRDTEGWPDLDVAPVASPAAGTVELDVVLGPRDDRFTPAARDALLAGTWHATPDLDRVGIRLDGPALARAGDDELPSEGLVPGAIQVPTDGRPVLFLADHPVTGGYPVIAVVADRHLDRAAQLRPGQAVRFRLAAG